MFTRTKTKIATTAAVAAALTLVGGQASAATGTFTDEPGDVSVYSSAPRDPYVKAIDISSMKIAATTKTVSVTIKAKDVRPTTDANAQEFTAQLIPSKTNKSGFIFSKYGVTLSSDDHPSSGTAPSCKATQIVDGVGTDISSQLKCVRNATANTVTFTLPTSAIPQKPKYLIGNASAYARVKVSGTSSYYYATSGNDYVSANAWTKIG